jgi:hypothetical protein
MLGMTVAMMVASTAAMKLAAMHAARISGRRESGISGLIVAFASDMPGGLEGDLSGDGPGRIAARVLGVHEVGDPDRRAGAAGGKLVSRAHESRAQDTPPGLGCESMQVAAMDHAL